MKNLLPFTLGRSINVMSFLSPGLAGKIGFRLFCYPFRAKLKGFHHKFLETSEQSTFSHGKTQIRVYKWKKGQKKILFLHGWQSHSFRWKNYIENFQNEDYTLYALDAPGHGLSTGSFLTVPLYSEVVEKFIREIGGVDAIVSHSLGAFTALHMLYRVPALPVSKLVLLAPPGNATEFVSFYQKALGLSERSLEHVRNHFRNVINEPVEFFSATKFAANLSKPGLIIHDEEDDETSHIHSIQINEVWKQSRLILTKGLTHNLKSPHIVDTVWNFVNESKSEPVSQLL